MRAFLHHLKNQAEYRGAWFINLSLQDYEFLEEQLAVSYANEHTFCFAVDKKVVI